VVPAVTAAASTTDVAALVRNAAMSLVLHESATRSLASMVLPVAGDLLLIVGPEGGLTPDELEAFDAAGATAVRLGPQVLRTSTAAAVALGALGVLTGRWA
jgi:16S rRNA (uracil1498-N3)-methyltransferase